MKQADKAKKKKSYMIVASGNHLNITHFHYPLSNLAWVIVMADKADYMRTYDVSKDID